MVPPTSAPASFASFAIPLVKEAPSQPQEDYTAAARAGLRLAEQGASQKWQRSKILMVGEGRTGKTSTLKSMVGEDFNPEELSTPGLKLGAECAIARAEISSQLKWVKLEESQTQQQYIAAVGRLSKEVSKEATHPVKGVKEVRSGGTLKRLAPSVPVSPSAVVSKSAVIATGVEEDDSINTEASMRLMEDMVLKATTNKDNTGNLVLSSWDFGGQRVFYTVHHLFLTEFGVYMVTVCQFSCKYCSYYVRTFCVYFYHALPFCVCLFILLIPHFLYRPFFFSALFSPFLPVIFPFSRISHVRHIIPLFFVSPPLPPPRARLSLT